MTCRDGKEGREGNESCGAVECGAGVGVARGSVRAKKKVATRVQGGLVGWRVCGGRLLSSTLGVEHEVNLKQDVKMSAWQSK